MLDRNEILELAKQTGVLAGYEGEPSYLVIFAKALMDVEREAIIDLVAMYGGPVDLEAAIRTRGEG
jgi:hypothetical protein